MTIKILCPKCQSDRLVKYGSRIWSHRELKQQWRCKDCGRLTIYPLKAKNNKRVTVAGVP